MIFTKTKIPDVVICKTDVYKDNRGYFMETFKKDELEKEVGFAINFCQDNESSSIKGVLRGLHYQTAPHAQAKLVRVVVGSVLDIAVDLRKNSPTLGEYIAIELNDENKYQLFIPKGFAHGFVTLSDTAIFSYKVDALYNKESERGIIYNDPTLQIDWQLPKSELIISEKDKILPILQQAPLFEPNFSVND